MGGACAYRIVSFAPLVLASFVLPVWGFPGRIFICSGHFGL